MCAPGQQQELTSSSSLWKLFGTRDDVAAPRVLRLPAAGAGVLRLRVLRPTSTSSAGSTHHRVSRDERRDRQDHERQECADAALAARVAPNVNSTCRPHTTHKTKYQEGGKIRNVRRRWTGCMLSPQPHLQAVQAHSAHAKNDSHDLCTHRCACCAPDAESAQRSLQ